MIRRLLVANRSEIARRIFRSCREMGIGTVAVYSDADRGAPFVGEADEAVALGGSHPTDSYLKLPALLEAARRTGADAIHPGYGFLAENPEFARAVEEAGITWVGPPAAAVETMASKIESKRVVEAAGVPVLAAVTTTGDILTAAEGLGYPLLVKASAGGGGKGMRVVPSPSQLEEAVASAARESAAAFGDDTLFLERYLANPRHIEIQIFGDHHGNVVSLFERECSIQRRHQKIIEESPSTALDDTLRKNMGEAAIAAARSVGYVGAGTVEFLFQEGEFFFLEMNTRLQVEHPVTEEITGLDLVRLQLLVAAGEPLPEEALEPATIGHAIEARLYAEDPRHDFLPATGHLHRFRFPQVTGLRVESGVEDGSEITPYYDPLLAKVIAWAPSREEAASLLATALQQAEIHGSITNRDLLVRLLRHSEFLTGNTDTGFLDRHSPVELGRPLPPSDEVALGALAAAICAQGQRRRTSPVLSSIPSGWRNSPSQLQRVDFTHDYQRTISVGYRFLPNGHLVAEIDGEQMDNPAFHDLAPDKVGLEVDGHLRWFKVHSIGETHHVDGPSGYSLLVEQPRFPVAEIDDEPGSLHAPMPGQVVRVEVAEGEVVVEGQLLVVMEAMKMEHSLRAPHAGKVVAIRAQPGDQVDAGQVLAVVEA